MYENEINKDALKPGDAVGVRQLVQFGWSRFKYPLTVEKIIRRITPARTKFVTEDGDEYSKNTPFYHITAEDMRKNEVVINAAEISRCRRALGGLDITELDDETIVKIGRSARQICNELSKEG